MTVRRLSLITVLFLAALIVAATFAWPVAAKPNVPPKPAISASPNPAQINQAVTFDGSASSGDGQGGAPTTFEWDLDGDGSFETNTGSVAKTSRAYADAQTIKVRLRLTDDEGDTAEASTTVRVNAPPVASFTYQPKPATPRKQVTLSSTSSDSDGAIPDSGYAWDLDGDHAYDDAFGQTVSTAYRKPGKHRVRLLVTDADGATATAARDVRVERDEPRPRLMEPFPTVRLRGAITSGGITEIDLLAVRGPRQAKAAVKCEGPSCPFDRRSRRLKHRRVEFPGIEGDLRPEVVIEVFVTEPGRIGKYTRFKLRDGRVPKREDRCLKPDSHRQIDCPGDSGE